jgi:hypothetical protein
VPPPEPARQSAQPSPKAKALQKQIERLQKKLADTKAAGRPTKSIEDRIYEAEDELRLLQER